MTEDVELQRLISQLTNPSRLFSRAEALGRPSAVPKRPGVYGWYLRKVPSVVPTEGCAKIDDLSLLYVGISPENAKSTRDLHDRVCYHFRGNAQGSTLRLTLGILLAAENGYPLRRVGSGTRRTFTHPGEQWLDDWMARNAFVCWAEQAEPWKVEGRILRELDLPLNIGSNGHGHFSRDLSKLRKAAVVFAKSQPVAEEHDQQRSMPKRFDAPALS